ncbi:MAG: hypothetical protein QM755_06390 [Luteolibacter sp.]
MKMIRLFPGLVAGFAAPICGAATVSQTFEAGEDTTNWGSTWNGGSTVPAFLDPSAGGLLAGGGASNSQSFSREFRNNTAGLDITTDYSIAMDIQVNTFDGPSNGQFEIVDGSYGSGNAANLRIFTLDEGDGNYSFHWQARDNNAGWQDLGITMNLGSIYHVQLSIDPDAFTYSAVVSLVDSGGNVLNTSSLADLAFDQNVIGNHQNGSLLYYIQASSGGSSVFVDNINIQSVPEPESFIAVLGASAVFAFKRRQTSGRSHS